MTSVRLFVLAAAVLGAILGSVSGAAHAADYKAVGASPAIMYDAPSERGRKVFIAPRGMPVEIVLTYGEWSKVRDVAGDLLWIESKALTSKRTVVVKVPAAKIRSAADDGAPVAFTADRSVILELAEAAGSGWIKVRHRDGLSGFVKAADIWGD